MSDTVILITAVSSDQETARQIQDILARDGLHAANLPDAGSADEMHSLVATLEAAIAGGGILTAVLSKDALRNHLFISNIQYASELASRRKALIFYRVEDIPRENPLALYYPQAVTIREGKNTDASLRRIRTQVKCLLGIERERAAIPERLKSKTVRRVAAAVGLLSLLAGTLAAAAPGLLQSLNREQPVIATPVVFEEPFSGLSVDQGIVVDIRAVPDPIDRGAPEVEAPFFFEPAVIHKQITFDDPAMNHALDTSVIDYSETYITCQEQILVRQVEGALQIAAAPGEREQYSTGLQIKHLFLPEQLDYFGMRFYLDDYQGWSDAVNPNKLWLAVWYESNQGEDLLGIDLSSRILDIPHAGTSLELTPGWHTLELRTEPSSGQDLILYLDGEEVGTVRLQFDPTAYGTFALMIDVSYSTEWVTFLVDEIVYGGDSAFPVALEPEQAPFRFFPDEVLFASQFDVGIDAALLTAGSDSVRAADGVMNFSIPPGGDNAIVLEVPAGPISTWNYFAVRYRLSEASGEYWSTWGNVNLSLYSREFQHPEGYSLSVSSSRYETDYTFTFGRNQIFGMKGSPENYQPGAWHTMEMVLVPLSSGEARYSLQYWQDGGLVGQGEVEDGEEFLDESRSYTAAFQVPPGNNRTVSFSGEVHEIVFGFLHVEPGE